MSIFYFSQSKSFWIIIFFIVCLTAIYINRESIKKLYKKWGLHEIEFGIGKISAKFRKKEKKNIKTAFMQKGVEIKGNFSQVKIKNIRGRDNMNRTNSKSQKNPSSSGVLIDGEFKDVEISEITGRDNISNE